MELRRTPPSRPPNPALPYREDCWSEGDTSVLIDAWGDRYVELNRGNFRLQHWQEVADAVNSRPCDACRPPRTDVQCKNRVDTLKKKYKAERSKIVDGASRSRWIFYDRLDSLLGNSFVNKPAMPAGPPMAVPLPAHWKGASLPTAVPVRQNAIMPVAEDFSFYWDGGDELESDSLAESSGMMYRKKAKPMGPGKGLMKEEDTGIRELLKAIVRMAEVYENVELEKQRQMMEMESQRMEFAKKMEFQRMQMFVDAQVSLTKAKRGKKRNTDDGRYL